jgi:class 3 adenylate cyclase/tetratricopeptide (TPR) repeat protein
VPACPSCGKELPGAFPFCPFCATPLTGRPAASVQEERKVVSVLFCDLVGFTATSEAADPEDVRARIRPYHARLRQEIERYGGTVEKFIGDAVMAVFGAPVAHEDDAERAVRAGLRILEAIEELNAQDPALSLQVRVGINTGEAVVALGARPEEGEGIVTGDVVNTASRLQGAAPVNGVAVSEQTYRATERVFDYEQLEPVQVKGKAEPLVLFHPLAARARFGSDLTRTHATPLVGRDLEKPLLIGTFERSAQQRSCQLVTIVGEPGVGKSRLCAELFSYIEDRPGIVRWRQGRCLPYGEGIAFWALGEIVKAECGILESDSHEGAKRKLEQTLPRGDPDLAWLGARLAPLVGLPSEPTSQEESFAAWRRVLENWAEGRETVLVFEDLHWADEALLAFLEHLAEWAEGVPLLLLCTARPELYEQHPGFGTHARNAQRINLPRLTDEETARLVSTLLERAVLPAETQQALLERAGGNPLYAEEFVRLLADHGERSGAADVPESVQALIAARLDTLSPERKSLLQDAAVLGKVFWAGALADMGSVEQREVEQALHALAQKELVRPARSSSMSGEAEYGFWHVLVRDVCYAQIPRAARAARHRAAAAWIEGKVAERAEDLADVLAYHYLSALELARAAGRTAEATELEASAIRYLALAGERALGLDVERAEQHLARALELAHADRSERASLLERWATAAHQLGRLQDARAAWLDAASLYRSHGEAVATGRVLSKGVTTLWALGDPRRRDVMAEAIAVLEAEPAGRELMAAYGELAGFHLVNEELGAAIDAAERALELATMLRQPAPGRALGFRGLARCFTGDRGGFDDLHQALERSVEESRSRDAAVHHAHLAQATAMYDGPDAAMRASRDGVAFCERRGIAEFGVTIAAQSVSFVLELGRSEDAIQEAELLAVQAEPMGNFNALNSARSVQLRVLAQRGDGGEAVAVAEQLASRARETGIPSELPPALLAAAEVLLVTGRRDASKAMLHDFVAATAVEHAGLVPEAARCALALSAAELLRGLVETVEPVTPLSKHSLCACRGLLAEANRDHAEAAALYAGAAERWRQFGNVPERAYALLGHGRCLAALGQPGAEAPLREARELFASMGYKPALAETETLLGESEAAAV